MSWSTRLRYRFGDIDDAGIAYYPKLLHEDLLGFAPVTYGDEPDVHLGVLAMGESSVAFGLWMTVGDEPRPRCRARITTAAVHMTQRTKQALPGDWRAKFSAYAIDEADFPAGR